MNPFGNDEEEPRRAFGGPAAMARGALAGAGTGAARAKALNYGARGGQLAHGAGLGALIGAMTGRTNRDFGEMMVGPGDGMAGNMGRGALGGAALGGGITAGMGGLSALVLALLRKNAGRLPPELQIHPGLGISPARLAGMVGLDSLLGGASGALANAEE